MLMAVLQVSYVQFLSPTGFPWYNYRKVRGNNKYIMNVQQNLPSLISPSYKEFLKASNNFKFTVDLNERCSNRSWSGEWFHAPLGNHECFESVT